MIIPDATHHDLLNYHLKQEAMRAGEAGAPFSIWHGRDTFTQEDVELLLNLDDRRGYLALGDRITLAGRLIEDGPMVTLIFNDTTEGSVTFDLDDEDLKMTAARIGVTYVPGEDPKLELYDKLTNDVIFETSGDDLHDLVDRRHLDPRDYPGSGLKYVESLGLV